MAISLICPETGQQELWELAGRVNALHDFLVNEASDGYSRSSARISTIGAIMGWTDLSGSEED